MSPHHRIPFACISAQSPLVRVLGGPMGKWNLPGWVTSFMGPHLYIPASLKPTLFNKEKHGLIEKQTMHVTPQYKKSISTHMRKSPQQNCKARFCGAKLVPSGRRRNSELRSPQYLVWCRSSARPTQRPESISPACACSSELTTRIRKFGINSPLVPGTFWALDPQNTLLGSFSLHGGDPGTICTWWNSFAWVSSYSLRACKSHLYFLPLSSRKC